MTTPNLADLRALSDSATPGPWHISDNDDQWIVVEDNDTTWTPSKDAALIAAMRNALPALLDEVEALREQVLAGRQATEDAAALRKAIADVLALADKWASSQGLVTSSLGKDLLEVIARHITPDAPASEATKQED